MLPLTPSALVALVDLAATGHAHAFAELVARFQDMAVGYARAVLRDRAGAEDAAQDAFVEAWRSLGQLREPAAFPGWLRRIVFKHCDRRRRRAAAAEAPLAQREPAAPHAEDDPRPRALVAAIAELPAHEREAVELYYLAGRSVAATAAFLEIGAEAVKSRLHAARARLRERLADDADAFADATPPSSRPSFLDQVMRMLKPDVLASDEPHGPWSCRGSDLWDLFVAAITGDVPAIRRLLARDPDLHRGEYWYTKAIHFAVREGHLDATRELLAAGCDPAAIEHGGESLVDLARDRGHEPVARLLEASIAARGGDARVRDDHAVHLAAEADDATRVAALLDAQPDLLERRDARGRTPLLRAAGAGARAVIALLLDRGAEIAARNSPGHVYATPGADAVDLALARRDLETARLLVARGAPRDTIVAAAFGDGAGVAALLDADPERIRETRPGGMRALSAAVEFGHGDIARLLLARGADPNAAEGAEAPRGAALYRASRGGDLALAELLLAHGADPNAEIESSGNATFIAKTPEMRRLLQERGGRLDTFSLIFLGEDEEVARRVAADPRAADEGCGTAFAAACKLGRRALVERMLAAGARVPPVVTGCRSYLWHDPELLGLLLASGMNPDLPDWQRATPLHDLCSRDGRGRARPYRERCAALLLDAGATIAARDEEYRSTPLAWAARNALPEMVELLLARGAPPELADDEPWATPLAWARRRGHAAIVERLARAGARR